MSYRNGTYVAFHAGGTNMPIDSDIKYYNLIKAWSAKKDIDFTLINSHEKTYALRTTSNKKTLQDRLAERLRNHSKNMVLIITKETKKDTDWVPFEIEYAIKTCKIPIIAAYPDFDNILNPSALADLWPKALKDAIENGTASCIHVPFKKEPITDAIDQFSFNKYPIGRGLGIYSKEAYAEFGIKIQ